MKFKTYTLGELVKIKYGKNQKNVQSTEGKYPIYGTGGLMGYATEPLYSKSSVLIGRKGTIDRVKYVDHPFWTVDTLFYTVVNEELVLPKYLYYRMTMIDLSSYNEGVTIPSLRTETLNRIILEIPSIEEQKSVLTILNSIDDKIELNNKIKDNLQQQVYALFDSWFVAFDRTDGEMPSDWHEVTLGDIAAVTSGKRPPMKQSAASADVTVPLVGAASIMGFTNAVLYNEPILVTGRVGTHGVVQRFQSPCWTSDNTLVIKSNFYEYTFQVLQRVDYVNMNRGSTQPLITQTDLKNVSIVIPTEEVLLKFERLAGSLMAMYESNRKENERLAALRDTLLPRLMSGEIDVSNIEI